MPKDYIDFPCSPSWLGFYYEQGLTPRKPQEDNEILLKRIEKLEEENSRLLALLLKQKNKEFKEINIQNTKLFSRF